MPVNENIRQWFRDLLNDEISSMRGTIKNEHLWALGADTPEGAAMHEQNCEEGREYIEFLEDVRKHYLGE